MKLEDLLEELFKRNGSDLHIIPGYLPTIRVNGELTPLYHWQPITSALSNSLLLSILNDYQKEILINNKEIDLSYLYGNFRFRVNLYYSQKNLCGNFRLIPREIKTIENLNLPSFLHNCKNFKQGLILITGPTGQGKSTTLASIINEINLFSRKHIITIEDPIEFVYPQGKSIISQRELHEDTLSWPKALRSALREDPDVILVGEMRDYDTIQAVLTAAETGHLVFSTLHTNSTPETIDRIVDVFPSHQQNQIRNQLASTLKIILSQKLIPKIKTNERIPAVEILVNTHAVSSVIRDGKTFLIDNILQTQEQDGHILFEKYLSLLYKNNLISLETASTNAIRPLLLKQLIN